MLAQSTLSWRTHIRTHGSKVHKAGDDDDPEVHGVNHVATVELEGKWALDTLGRTTANKEPTIRPSASQLFRRNMRLGTVQSDLELDHRYPSGPGDDRPPVPGKSRLSMKETD